MVASEDEYDAQAGGVIELTEEDCAVIDALSSNVSSTQPRDIPHIDVRSSEPDVQGRRDLDKDTELRSPYNLFRHYGHLSVSDLVAPAWCEVQFDYGLRQHRSKKIDKRPEAFVSKEGKKIRVEKKTAQANDIILRGGHAVHSILEREIHPPKVQVKVETLEDRWGVRLLDMICYLQTLMLIGKCREFPVMGFIHDHLVIGVIDEITRTPISVDPPTPESSHKKRPPDASPQSTPHKPNYKRTKSGTEPSSPEKQLKLSSFFPVTPRKSTRSHDDLKDDSAASIAENSIPFHQDAPEPDTSPVSSKLLRKKTHILHIVDSKTRHSPTLPQHSATLSSRLQLMIYKRLLDSLLLLSPRFDFDKLWKHLGANSKRMFSRALLYQLQNVGLFGGSEVKCLKDLEESWSSAVDNLGVSEGKQNGQSGTPVDEQLTLVYRLRATSRRGQGGTTSKPYFRLQKSPEDENLEKALRESLQHNLGPHGQGDRDSGETQEAAPANFMQASTSESPNPGPDVEVRLDEHASAQEALKSEEVPDLEMDLAVRESLKIANAGAPRTPPRVTTSEADYSPLFKATNQTSAEHVIASPPVQIGGIIGEKTVNYDRSMLDEHLTSVLAWWHGKREPRGVEVEESSRCHSCEYMSGCEWREKMALEAYDNIRQVKGQPEG